jgi:hypothetical protein
VNEKHHLTLIPKPKPPRPRKVRVKVIAEAQALQAALDAIRGIAIDGDDMSITLNVIGSAPGEERS